jgi:hypothetical protein
MTATVVPFPIVRRHGFIERQAEYASHMNPDGRVRYLSHQIRLQADAMRRKGISEDLVQREIRCMTTALRSVFPGARRAT